MQKEYQTVDGFFSSETIIEKSKFICYIKGISDENDAKEFINTIKKQNSLATHNCYAYIADENGLTQKFSDDGEPQGTAGIPMLEVLKKSNLKKICAVTTRYFGGIKLGTGGLSRAYSSSVIKTLNQCTKVNYIIAKICNICCSYDKYSTIQNLLNDENIALIENSFNDKISLKIAITCDFFDDFICKIKEKFNGENILTEECTSYFKFRSKNA